MTPGNSLNRRHEISAEFVGDQPSAWGLIALPIAMVVGLAASITFCLNQLGRAEGLLATITLLGVFFALLIHSIRKP